MPEANPDPELLRLIAAGQKLQAIKRYRDLTGLGLAEAKAAVEALQRGEPVGLPSAPPTPAGVTPPMLSELRALALGGQKIEAIKRWREATGSSLREAKEAVEALEEGTLPAMLPPPTPGAPQLPVPHAPGSSALSYLLDESTSQSIDVALRSGQRTQAIAAYVKATGLPQAQAEAAISAREREMGGGKKSGCFVATAAWGSPMAAEVAMLRRFRDTVLRRNRIGRRLVLGYYRASPPVAALIARRPALRGAARWLLRPCVALARVAVRLRSARS